jgi:pimeloyl-ACP methyl ester carboxylesterase
MMVKLLLLSIFGLLWLTGCSTFQTVPDLGNLYNQLAQQEDPARNPVIVIPGILGSRLEDGNTGDVVWGAFGSGAVDPTSAEGAPLLALPMEHGAGLKDLRDSVRQAGALDRVILKFFGIPIELNAYYNILRTLGVGGYRDQQLAESHAVDYGNRHFTCFQFAYDWRRDLVESAQKLDQFIKAKEIEVQEEIFKRFGVKRSPVKFDLVAHSMGSLVARYYLRYGPADLPADGSLPPVTWEGAKHVDHLVVIGPPNAGSVETLTILVDGLKPAPLLSTYPAAIVGTMPSVYQLLPRSRHRPLLDVNGQPVPDVFDPALWERHGWGLADPSQDEILVNLLPDIRDAQERRRVARDHLRKVLARAKQLTAALDVPADVPAHPPDTTPLLLVAGDSMATMSTAQIQPDGRLKIVAHAPGDGVVLRQSALMDEREEKRLGNRLTSPIGWSQVLFIFSDHLGMTKDPAFVDNILYFLLESPRSGSSI